MWTNDTEILATIAELLYSLLGVTVKAHGGQQLPRFRIRRPSEGPEKPVGFGQFARGL